MPFSSVVGDGQFAYSDGTVRVMCHKQTNTDWSPRVAVDQSQTEVPDVAGTVQSRSDGSHSTSSIRRWQTFSPAGINEDSHICRVCTTFFQFLFSRGQYFILNTRPTASRD